MDQARAASRQPVPGLVRLLGIGRVDQSYYCSYELVEGRSLRAVIDRAGEERFPFAAENALMVASRTSAILEQLHARKDESGRPRIHGLLQPSHLLVSWEGDVQLAGFGAWPSLRGTGLLGAAGERYLAPEQVAGEPGDPRSDVFSLALVLLETLTHGAPDGSDPLEGLAAARFVTIAGDEEPLPDSLAELLRRALSPQPSSRYESMGELRKAIDTLLFSGDFTPTTFNLAYFMHTLFRQDMEGEAVALEEARQADYTEFLPPPPTDPAVSGAAGAGAPPRARRDPGAAPARGSARRGRGGCLPGRDARGRSGGG
jgi:serine/threonine protein kinase